MDRILLVFIFAELLGTIITIVLENEVRAEPFLLIGLIAGVFYFIRRDERGGSASRD